MKLSPQDAKLFYKLMWPLQFYVNQQHQILPHVDSLEAYIECPLSDKLAQTTKKLKGGESPVQSPAFGLLRASANLAQTAVHDPDDIDTLWKRHKSVQRALRRLETVLYRAEW